jgi:hypothetical protein
MNQFCRLVNTYLVQYVAAAARAGAISGGVLGEEEALPAGRAALQVVVLPRPAGSGGKDLVASSRRLAAASGTSIS